MNALMAYFLLAFMSISIICQLLMIYAFIKIKKIRRHPGIYILIETLAHLLIEIHWVSVLNPVKNQVKEIGCKIIGATTFYCSTIAFNYILFLTLEVYFKISKTYIHGYKKRGFYYHVIAQMTSIPCFVFLIVIDQNGESKFGGCSIEENIAFEMVPAIRNFIYVPLILIFFGLAFYKRSTNDSESISTLKYHFYVIFAFIITFTPIQLINGSNYSKFNMKENNTTKWVRNICVLLNVISGAAVFFARFSQKTLLKHLWISITGRKKNNISLKQLEIDLLPYSNLFKQLDKKMQVNNILASIITVFSDFSTAGNKSINGEKKWTYEYMNNTCNVTLYHYKHTKRVLDSDCVKIKTFLYSFDTEVNSEGLISRYTKEFNSTFTYLTYDKKFYLKTFSQEDMHKFSSIFPSYSQRQQRPSSSLISIYGFFTIEYKNESAIHFALYENLGCAFQNPKTTIIKPKPQKNIEEINISTETSIEWIKIPENFRKKIIKSIDEDTRILSKFEELNYYLIIAFDNEVALIQKKKKLITCEGKTAVIGVCCDWYVWGTKEPAGEYRENLLNEVDRIFVSSF